MKKWPSQPTYCYKNKKGEMWENILQMSLQNHEKKITGNSNKK